MKSYFDTSNYFKPNKYLEASTLLIQILSLSFYASTFQGDFINTYNLLIEQTTAAVVTESGQIGLPYLSQQAITLPNNNFF